MKDRQMAMRLRQMRRCSARISSADIDAAARMPSSPPPPPPLLGAVAAITNDKTDAVDQEPFQGRVPNLWGS